MKSASKAIIISENKYLLQHRDNKANIWSPNCWGLFGGQVDSNETPESCLIREVKEELSINCKILKKIHQCLNNEVGMLNIFFWVSTNEKITSKKLREGQNLGWFGESEIEKMETTWDTQQFLKFMKRNNFKKKNLELFFKEN